MSGTSFKGFATTLSADPDARSLVDVLEAYGSQPMWRDTLLGVWHVERACPLVSATAGHLHPTVLSFANLPDRDLYCTRCSSHRAYELGRLVALLAPLLSHLGTFSSWRSVLSLHVALADPLRPFFKHTPAEFAQLNELLAPARCFLESLRRRCFHASLALDPSGLYGFLLDTTSTWSAVLDAPTVPPAMPSAPHPPRTEYLLCTESLARLPLGSEQEQALAMLCTYPWASPRSALIQLPPEVYAALPASPRFSLVALPDRFELSLVSMVEFLYATAPHRGLRSALDTALLLTSANA